MSDAIAVTGATGRMGREVLSVLTERDDSTVAFAVNRDAEAEHVDGIAIEPAGRFGPLLGEREPAAVIDFTGPEATLEYAAGCADAGVPFVTGTTGFTDEQRTALEEHAEAIPLLHAPNFARGVQTMVDVIGEIVRGLPGYDVELVETHHNGKRDAPSGTANRLLEAIETAGTFTERVPGREGDQPREAGEIGVHALRAGDVTGAHEIIIAGNHEELRLTHRAENRGVFAAGAVDAATWLVDQPPGSYDFSAVIGE